MLLFHLAIVTSGVSSPRPPLGSLLLETPFLFLPILSTENLTDRFREWGNFVWLSSMCHPCRGFLAILGPVIPPLPRWATLCRPSGTFSNTELIHYNSETLKDASFGHNALKQKGRPGFAGTPCESPWAI